MMDFLKKILDPKEVQFREIDLDHISKALQSETVRDLWIDKLVDLIRESNKSLDGLLDKADKGHKWEVIALERRTILRCLSMILDARDELESNKAAEEARNRLFEAYKGVSAPLNLDVRPNSQG